MLKFIILTVALLQQLLLQTDCLYISESCEVENQYGTCLPLSKCQSIANEIKRAGNPMPKYMRMKLQKLSCGFEFTEPLICCILPSIENTSHELETHKPGDETPQHKPNDVVFPGKKQDDNDNDESSTRRTVEDRSGPRDVAGHPNIDLLPPECGIIDSNRIWGGNRTSLYEMPFMVLLSYDSERGLKLSCSGTIINKWYILTAAHCVTNLSKLRLRLNGVIIGEYDVRHDPDCETSDGIVQCAPNVMNHTIDTVIPHPGYAPPALVDDIALIRLSEPADLSLDSVKPICLPVTRNRQTEPLAGLNGVVAGWGITEDGLQSPVLLSVILPIVSPKDCEAAYNGAIHISVTQICAGGVKNKDSCGGDSGGPLMYPGKFGSLGVRYIQRGIVSFGSKRCGISGYPGVYTNVAYYMDWILDNIHD